MTSRTNQDTFLSYLADMSGHAAYLPYLFMLLVTGEVASQSAVSRQGRWYWLDGVSTPTPRLGGWMGMFPTGVHQAVCSVTYGVTSCRTRRDYGRPLVNPLNADETLRTHLRWCLRFESSISIFEPQEPKHMCPGSMGFHARKATWESPQCLKETSPKPDSLGSHFHKSRSVPHWPKQRHLS